MILTTNNRYIRLKRNFVLLTENKYTPDGTYCNEWALNDYMSQQAGATVLAQQRDLLQGCRKLLQ